MYLHIDLYIDIYTGQVMVQHYWATPHTYLYMVDAALQGPPIYISLSCHLLQGCYK